MNTQTILILAVVVIVIILLAYPITKWLRSRQGEYRFGEGTNIAFTSIPETIEDDFVLVASSLSALQNSKRDHNFIHSVSPEIVRTIKEFRLRHLKIKLARVGEEITFTIDWETDHQTNVVAMDQKVKQSMFPVIAAMGNFDTGVDLNIDVEFKNEGRCAATQNYLIGSEKYTHEIFVDVPSTTSCNYGNLIGHDSTNLRDLQWVVLFAEKVKIPIMELGLDKMDVVVRKTDGKVNVTLNNMRTFLDTWHIDMQAHTTETRLSCFQALIDELDKISEESEITILAKFDNDPNGTIKNDIFIGDRHYNLNSYVGLPYAPPHDDNSWLHAPLSKHN